MGELSRQSSLDVQPMEYDPAWHEAVAAPARVTLWRDPDRGDEAEWVIVHVELDGKDLMGLIEGPLPPIDTDHPLYARLSAAVSDG